MASDLFGRDSGDAVLVDDAAKKMLRPTKQIKRDGEEDSREPKNSRTIEALNRIHKTMEQIQKTQADSQQNYDRLYDAVNNAAQRMDANAAADRQQAEVWAKTLNDFTQNFKNPTAQTGVASTNNDRSEELRVLGIVAETNQNLWKASQNQNGFWVSIGNLSGEAQRDIASAFKISGCCGVANEVVSKISEQIKTISKESNVTEAVKPSLTGSRGGGGGGSGGGGGDDSGGIGGGGRGGIPQPPGGWGVDPDDMPSSEELGQLVTRGATIMGMVQGLADGFTRMHRQLIRDLNVDPIRTIFEGQIVNHNNYRESLRKVIHAQQGFGEANREIEESYRHVTTAVSASGVSRAQYQEIYLRNLQRGLDYTTEEDKLAVKGLSVDKKEAGLAKLKATRMKSIQTSALSTASALSMDANATNELFMDWHMNLGMSANSMGEMSRHMIHISRNSGLTGEQMAAAMKSADGILKNMKKAGVASVDAAKRVTEFMASAKKFGFEGGEEFMSALATGQGFQDSKMKQFLQRSAAQSSDSKGALNDLMFGSTLQRPEGMKNLMGGIENNTRMMFRNFEGELNKIGMSADTMDMKNIDKVITKLISSKDPNQQAAGRSLQDQFLRQGIGPGEVSQLYKSLEESSRTPLEKQAKLIESLQLMKGQNLTGTDEYKRTQQALTELQTNTSMDAFGRIGEFSEKIKAAGGMTAELKKEMLGELSGAFGNEETAADFLNNIGKNAGETLQNVNKRAEAAGMNFDALLAKRNMTRAGLQEALAKGDQGAVEALQETMQDIQAEETANQDPISDIRRTLHEIQNSLGGGIDSIGFGLSTLSMNILYMAGFLGGFLSLMSGGISLLTSVLPGLGTLIANLFGGLRGMLGGGRPGMPGGGRPGMPGGPVAPSPIGGPMAPSPVGGPMAPPIIGGPSGGGVADAAAGRRAVVTPGGPDYGGGGWAGTRGAGVLESPAAMKKAGASRADRRANAEKYLAARQAGGQSGKGFGARAGSGYRRMMPQGRGLMGMLGKIGNFAMRNPELTAGLAGAGIGYATSDSETTMGALGDAAMGGTVGAGLGYGGKMLMGRGGLQAGGLPGMAGTAMMGADMMSGMPGYGSNCVPVCIVGGLEGFGGMMGGGMMGGGIADTALNTLNTVDMASDAASMVGKGGKVAGVADDVAKAAAGGVDDAAKAGGWFSRMMGKVPGGTKLMEKASGVASTVSTKASGLMTGAKSLVGTVGDDVALKAATAMPGLAKAGNAVGTVAKGSGALLGKLAGPLSLAVGGLTGAMEAESAGRTTTEGAVYGALTGGAHKGSFASEMIGLEKGGAADEMLGVAGAAGVGAMTGAAIGSVVPVVGTAVGAGVGAVIGAGAELTKVFTAEESGLRDAVTGFATDVGSTIMGLPGTIGGAFESISSYLGEGANSIYQSVSGFATNIGTTFSSGIDGVSKGLANIANTASEGFAGTAKDNWNRMVESGPSVVGAAGQLAGGVGDVMQGNISQGASKAALAIVEALGAGGQTLMGGAKAALSTINPWNWFKEGTREIQTPGIGMLHAGEMIIPKEALDDLKASGNGKFQGGIFGDVMNNATEVDKNMGASIGGGLVGQLIHSMTSGISSALGMSLFGPIGGVVSSLTSVIGSNKTTTPETSTSLQGAFEKGQAIEALDTGFETSLKQGDVSGLMNSFIQSGDPTKMALAKQMQEDFGKLASPTDSFKDLNETGESSIVEQAKQTMLLAEIGKKIGDANTSWLGAFEQGESLDAMDSASQLESKEMSYWGTAIGAAIAGPIGAMAGFVADSSMSGLGIGDALNQTVETLKTGTKSVANMLTLGLFDSDKSDEAGESNITGMIEKTMPSLLGGMVAGVGGATGLIGNSLIQAIGGKLGQTKAEKSDALDLGLFDSGKLEEANDLINAGMIGKALPAVAGSLAALEAGTGLMSQSLSKAVSDQIGIKGAAGALNLGLFDSQKQEEANDADIQSDRLLLSKDLDLNKYSLNAIEKRLDGQKNISEKNIVAEVSRALDYETAGSDAATDNKIKEYQLGEFNRTLNEDISTNPMDYRDDMKGLMSPTYMDYRDDMKGEVGTLGLSRINAESSVEQEKYGSQPYGGTSILPSMDTIASYLVTDQALKLDTMIKVMEEIRDKLPGASSSLSTIVGSSSPSSIPSSRPGIKSMAKDAVRGKWDLTYGDYSPGTVTTDGRGGM